jgi:hypothetical protein
MSLLKSYGTCSMLYGMDAMEAFPPMPRPCPAICRLKQNTESYKGDAILLEFLFHGTRLAIIQDRHAKELKVRPQDFITHF